VVRSLRGIGSLRRWQRAARTRPPGLFDGPPTRFGRALGPRRSFATTSLSLAECRRVKQAFGATLNDVMLALSGGALRRYLAAHDELPDRPLAASVPVSADSEPRMTGNRLAFLQTTLHCEIADPVERLAATRAMSDAAKQQLEAMGRDLMLEWMEYLPPLPYTWVRQLQQRLRLADRLPSPSNVVVSNVPGPREELWWSGSRMESLFSVGPLSEGIGLNLTVWSYRDRMNVAALADRDQVGDLEQLLEGLHAELAALRDAAESR
jgi:diacylglycerol O-acyltransferase